MDQKNILSKKFFLSVLFLFLLTRFLLNCFIPVMDSSEARYAAIVKNMTFSNNYVEPTFIFNGESVVFKGKPPLAFQMGAVTAEVFGVNNFSIRFPAFLFAAVILLLIYVVTRKQRGEKTALFAALFCISTFVFYLYAGLCMTDMVLTAAIVGAVISYILFTGENESRQKKFYSLWIFFFLGLGMITKGPVAIVMSGLPIFFYILINRKWKELTQIAWLRGITLFLVISVPWFWIMTQKHPGYLQYFFVNENFKRFLFKDYGDQFGVGRETFRGMAIIWFLLANLPTIFLLYWPFSSKVERGQIVVRRIFRDPLSGVTVLGVITITLFWSLTSRVLITYLLPTVPFFSIFIAERLNELGYFERDRFIRYLKKSFFISMILIPVAFALVGILGARYSSSMPEECYRQVRRITEEDPILKNCDFYFLRITPFSAEYYFGDRVKNHSFETPAESLDRSSEQILFARKKDIKRAALSVDREVLLDWNCWTVFRPKGPSAKQRTDEANKK